MSTRTLSGIHSQDYDQDGSRGDFQCGYGDMLRVVDLVMLTLCFGNQTGELA